MYELQWVTDDHKYIIRSQFAKGELSELSGVNQVVLDQHALRLIFDYSSFSRDPYATLGHRTSGRHPLYCPVGAHHLLYDTRLTQ